MFNTKNIITILISAIISSLITWAITENTSFSGITSSGITSSGITSLLFNAFLALILMQLLQNFKPKSIRKSLTKIAPAKKIKSPPSDANRETGTVKWFDSGKGYGFITRAMGEDIFVHFRSIKGNGYRSLREGQAVEFIVTEGIKGPQAEDIHIVK